MIYLKRFGSFQNLKLVFSWVFRFFIYLKQKILKKLMLLKEILNKNELNHSEEILIPDNRKNLREISNISVI